MWLWRVSGTPWERHGQSTRWFNARTPAIAVFHVSPLAAVCARLVHQRRHTPELLDPEERLYSIRVSLRQVQAAHVSRGWYDNLKETRTVAAAWRMQALCPVLKVPARDGQHQYLVNLRFPSPHISEWRRADAAATGPSTARSGGSPTAASRTLRSCGRGAKRASAHSSPRPAS